MSRIWRVLAGALTVVALLSGASAALPATPAAANPPPPTPTVPTPVTTSFTCATQSTVVVDPATGHVFAVCSDSVEVLDAAGHDLATVAGAGGTSATLVGSSLYVLSSTAHTIVAVSLSTFAITATYPVGHPTPAHATQGLTAVGGKLWFVTGHDAGPNALAWLNPSDSSTGVTGSLAAAVGGIEAIPGATSLLAFPYAEPSSPLAAGTIERIDVATTPVTTLATLGVNVPLRGFGVSADGSRFWIEAAEASIDEYLVSSMTLTLHYLSATAGPSGLAYSPADGGLLASVGQVWTQGQVSPAGVGYMDTVAGGPISQAFAPDGSTLYDLGPDLSGGATLNTYPLDPVVDSVSGSIDGTAPATLGARAAGQVWLTGQLIGAPTSVTIEGQASEWGWYTPTQIWLDTPDTLTPGPTTIEVHTAWKEIDLPITVSPGRPGGEAAPTATGAGAGDGSAIVSWAPPSDDGGSPITGYLVTAFARNATTGGPTCSTTGALTCTVTGLADDAGYTFTVAAQNAFGFGAVSPPSEVAVPKASGQWFHPVTPTRLLDSRPATQVGPYASPWLGGTTRAVSVAGVGAIPDDATAVTLNVTATDTTTAGYLTVWPADAPRPVASSLNWGAGQTVPNSVTVAVGTGGAVDVYNPGGQTDVVIDVTGYYSDDTGSGLEWWTPQRAIDSRPATQVGPYATPWSPGQTRTVALATGGIADVQTFTTAVVLNVTVTDTTSAGYLTVWPTGSPRPLASSLNWTAGETIANSVTVPLGPDGSIQVYSPAGQVDVVIDVTAHFDVGYGGKPFHPIAPTRVLDTRPATQVGPYDTPIGPDEGGDVQVAGLDGIPADAGLILTNVTVTDTTAPSYLAVWCPCEDWPGTSSLNWTPGQTLANSVTAFDGFDQDVAVANGAGSVDVVIDVSGWYS
jgi:hypothetical protein